MKAIVENAEEGIVSRHIHTDKSTSKIADNR